MPMSTASAATMKTTRSAGSPRPAGTPPLKGHHIRQLTLVAAAASWAGILYALGII